MQREGKVQYLKYHQGSVISVSFHPKDRFLFCSGAYDGKVNLYSCQRYEFLQSYVITSVSLARNVNAVRFNCEGDRILVSTTARKLSVIDVTRGDQILSYDNCTFNGRDRTGLATDPSNPNIAVSCCVNGRGIALFDLRMQLPLDFVYDIHTEVIRDVMFLHGSWPWCSGETTLVTAAEDGICRISTMDGRCLHTISANQPLNAVTITPELYDSGLDDGFCSLLMMGGSNICAYVPNEGIKETHRQNKTAPIWKLR
ncbi:hypothetical protein LSH36_487g02042 [Paralvinella palmiformis]|uniref:Uncharacterized protein n=1 Tax=Paralvinella palmiformis TaxID=53620 RepID=A0AAD9J8Y5_9ANNE|nr:hypothetical protein LSH36_487g02042 [Paralvinella palmiformis]